MQWDCTDESNPRLLHGIATATSRSTPSTANPSQHCAFQCCGLFWSPLGFCHPYHTEKHSLDGKNNDPGRALQKYTFFFPTRDLRPRYPVPTSVWRSHVAAFSGHSCRNCLAGRLRRGVERDRPDHRRGHPGVPGARQGGLRRERSIGGGTGKIGHPQHTVRRL